MRWVGIIPTHFRWWLIKRQWNLISASVRKFLFLYNTHTHNESQHSTRHTIDCTCCADSNEWLIRSMSTNETLKLMYESLWTTTTRKYFFRKPKNLRTIDNIIRIWISGSAFMYLTAWLILFSHFQWYLIFITCGQQIHLLYIRTHIAFFISYKSRLHQSKLWTE